MGNETPGGELLGALEAGGTKMVCATGYANGTVLERTEFPTTAPAETIEQIVGWFQGRGIAALGIGAFGPTGVNPKSSQYGYILDTPKVAWRNFNMLGALRDALGVPCGYDTDVNAACLGECSFGCGRDLDNVLYLTVGTGVGAGVMCEGKLVHGMLHPEAGHIRIHKDPDDPIGATSGCPYHDDCLEGLIAGPAIKKRWNGARASSLADDPAAMDLLSGYLAQALATYIMCLSPQKIIIGGGVADHTPIIELARPKAAKLINGYLSTPELGNLDNYIVGNSLDGKQGIMGCLVLLASEELQGA